MGSPRITRPAAGSLVLVLAWFALAASAATAAPPAQPGHPLFTRYDAWYGVAAVTAVTAVGFADRSIWQSASRSDGAGARRLADAVRPLATARVLAPGLILGLAAGHLFDRPGLVQASVRVSAAVVVAAGAAEALKLPTGRARPGEAPGDVDEFRPFSGHDSFPSGHASVAFAAAAAIDRETSARWVPWVVYPLAGLVGWTRVHDDRHWASDVVAGAALGLWAADKVEDLARARSPGPRHPGPFLSTGARGVRLGARLSF